MEEITACPLCWPAMWKRTSKRQPGRFGSITSTGQTRVSISLGSSRILAELKRMDVDSKIIISTNVPVRRDGLPYSDRREPPDPGVAVYWTDKNNQKRCMAVDQYDRVADNLAAIAATLDAMRSIERHGGAAILDRAFMGFLALPAPIAAGRPWREVLLGKMEYDGDITLERLEGLYRSLAKNVHGNHDKMVELNEAIRQAREFFKRK